MHRALWVALAIAGGVCTVGCSAKIDSQDNLVFIHHSCGRLWLENKPWFKPSLHQALLAKPYIGLRNDITYRIDVEPDPGRPDSLAPVAGDLTDMHHWTLWLNDYLAGVKRQGCTQGVNRIIVFKSCYPNSGIESDGAEPGDPFSDAKTLANYKAVYRHPEGAGHTYTRDGNAYRSLEDVFAANPDTLFIPITAPPLHFAPADATNDGAARRARQFNNWLKGEWLSAYIQRTGLHNVAVYDWFDVLAYPDSHPQHPNRLKEEFGGARGDSHPNGDATKLSTRLFATDPDSFLDVAWRTFRAPSANHP